MCACIYNNNNTYKKTIIMIIKKTKKKNITIKLTTPHPLQKKEKKKRCTHTLAQHIEISITCVF